MPLLKEIKEDVFRIFIWKYDEKDCLELDNDILALEIKKYHYKRQKEILIVRQILKEYLPDYKIFYHDNGKPYLFPKDIQISISHSFPLVALAVSNKNIGIDIEKINNRILGLKYKFLSQYELNWIINKPNLIEILTIIWTIKEALYKISSSHFYSFKENYRVEEFDILKNNIKCSVLDINKKNYTARIYRVENFFLSVII